MGHPQVHGTKGVTEENRKKKTEDKRIALWLGKTSGLKT